MIERNGMEYRLQAVDPTTGGSITWTTPEGILAALAEAGVLEVERHRIGGQVEARWASPWKEAK